MRLETLGIDASRASAGIKTGTEWYSHEIITALAALDDRPRLRLYHRPGPTPEMLPDAENILIEQSRFWTHVGLERELRKRPVDALFVPAHVIPRSHPAATVVTIHDLGYRIEPAAHTLRRRAELDLTTRWNARRAVRIIVPSEATRDDLEREYGTDPNRVDVIPHGIDRDRFKVLPEDDIDHALATLGIVRPYLLFVSTIQPRKNLSRLVSAFESPDLERFQLVVVGASGWKSGPIIDRLRASTRHSDIRQLGYVADDQLPALYNGAAAFVLPSLYEGFGMDVIEAMACGCPVVVSSAASLPEVAGNAAIVVDPQSVRDLRNGIKQATSPAESIQLRHAGLERASDFTWARSARQTLASILRAHLETAG